MVDLAQPISQMTTSASAGEGTQPVAVSAKSGLFRVNLVANLAGAVVTSVIQFLLVRIYLRQLGVEAYGLIGVMATLWTLVQLADVGISAAVNRELARRTALGASAREIRDMVRTLEVGYAVVGVVLGLVVLLASPFAEHWLRHDRLSGDMIRHSVQAMGLLIAAQWPLSFYQGVLLGLQRHGLFNSIRIAMATVTAVGAYVVLSRVSTTPLALFLWQAVMAVGQVGLLAVFTWRCLPRDSQRPRVRPESVDELWHVAAGLFGVTATALILSQIDRVVASRLLPLETFGFYMLGVTLANALLYTFCIPVYASVFPRLSALAALGDMAALRGAYRRDWALMIAATIPAAAAVSAFAHPLLLAWTGDDVAARVASPIAVLLTVGMALNGLGSITLALMVARNWTGAAVAINAALCAVALPAVWILANGFGALGVATVWPSINLCYVVAGLVVARRRLGRAAEFSWLFRDAILPAAAGALAVWAWRHLVPQPAGLPQVMLAVGSAWLVAVAAVVLVSPSMRDVARRFLASLTSAKEGSFG